RAREPREGDPVAPPAQHRPRRRHSAPPARHGRRGPPGGRPAPPHRPRGLQLIQVWRLCRRAHAAFDGEGGRLAGGRWNHRGVAVVYTSATLSLAALEYFVHVELADTPGDLVAVAADIPDDVARTELAVASLPADWRAFPAPERLASLGTRW